MAVHNRKCGWIDTLKRCTFLACVFTLLFFPLHSSFATDMTWEQYVLDVRNVEAEHGYYADWPLAEKERLIHALIDMGYMKNSSATKQLFQMDSNAGKSALADQILLLFMGGDGNSLVRKDGVRAIRWTSLTDVIMGPSITWTPAQKAWYQEVQNIGREPEELDTLVVPTAEDLPEEQAIAIARAAIVSAYGFDSHALDSFLPDSYLYVTQGNPEYRRWHVGFCHYDYGAENGETALQFYSAVVDENGEVIADPEMGFLHVDELAQTRRP